MCGSGTGSRPPTASATRTCGQLKSPTIHFHQSLMWKVCLPWAYVSNREREIPKFFQVWVGIYCRDNYGYYGVCMPGKMAMACHRDIVYIACFCVFASHTVAKGQTQIAQNMCADMISGGEGFMTHKSLWSAVHASELKQYTRDGGRGSERLPCCCRTHKISLKSPKFAPNIKIKQ